VTVYDRAKTLGLELFCLLTVDLEGRHVARVVTAKQFVSIQIQVRGAIGYPSADTLSFRQTFLIFQAFRSAQIRLDRRSSTHLRSSADPRSLNVRF
jgi:hypothetical protein